MRTFATACAGLVLSAALVQAQGGGQADKILKALDALRQSAYALQDSLIMDNPTPDQMRGLYPQVSKILIDATALANQVRDKGPKADLLYEYLAIENRVGKLVGQIDGLGEAYRPSKRNARRLRAAFDDLHYAFVGGAPPVKDTLLPAVQRQARQLGEATDGLVLVAKAVLGDKKADKALRATLDPLAKATADFGRMVVDKVDVSGLKTGFAAVNKAWDQFAAALKNVAGDELAHFRYSAARVDELQDRIFGMLGMPGKRVRLSAPQ
jgi:hypothetical protein